MYGPVTAARAFEDRRKAHVRLAQEHRAEAERALELENRISALRLASFLVAAIATYSAFTGGGWPAIATSFAAAATFVAGVIAHARVSARRSRELARQRTHERNLARIAGRCPGRQGGDLVEADHAYARDIDVVGEDSLVARIDVSHTALGAKALVAALCEGCSPEEAAARRLAVQELVDRLEWRRELEVAASHDGEWATDLDAEPFLRFTELPSLFAKHAWLRPVLFVLPLVTIAGITAAQLEITGSWAWLAPVTAQLVLLWWSKEPVHRALDWVTARLGFAESFLGMMQLLESESFESPRLQELQQTLRAGEHRASEHMGRLSRYESFAQLRTQGPVYLVVNATTLWDLFCLERLEKFNAEVGPHCRAWFEALAELELLCSLATLADTDPDARFPELAQDGPLELKGVLHPLLAPDARIANDLRLEGPSSAAVITGSNMAGKSTLLRAVGLNVALARAGGPVCAESARVPWVRLRASMRIEDSLQRGASYFRAELNKLQSVVSDLHETPPVLFLLDEVLRGTNSHARSVGAAAVVKHLLRAGSLGLVATHDTALARLEQDPAFDVHNHHFTDVFEDGEMSFDYQLREGVVKTSNALELLRMAGIEVEDEADDDDEAGGEGAESGTTRG